MDAFKFIRKPAIGVLFLLFITRYPVNASIWDGTSVVPPQPVRVLIIFDVSKSMSASYEKVTRMDAAKQLAFNIIDSLSGRADLQIALRSYGSVKQYPPGD